MILTKVNRRTMIAIYTVAIALFNPVAGIAVENPDGLVAKVDGTFLSREELNREMRLVSFKLTRQGRPVSIEQLKQYEKDIRETIINRVLMLQQTEKLEIVVKNGLVNKAMGEFKAGFKNEKAYSANLAKMGLTEIMLHEQIQEGLTIKALLEKYVLKGITVPDEQVHSYYTNNPNLFKSPEQVKASHILIKVPANADQAEKEKALITIQGLKSRVAKGENFATLAQDYSDCPSRAKGGDLGFFARKQMVSPFSKAAFDLAPGETSDVVETRFGYHLIRVTERMEVQTLAFSDVKKQIAGRLQREKEEQRIGAYVSKLKKKADIQRYSL